MSTANQSSRAKSKATVVDADLPRCPECGSTDRTDYNDCNTIEFEGVHERFGSYSHIVLRRTRCKQCDRARVDRFYEMRRAR